jgi:predicted transcriptional regulator
VTLTIEVPDELRRQLDAEAERTRRTREELALGALEDMLQRTRPFRPVTAEEARERARAFREMMDRFAAEEEANPDPDPPTMSILGCFEEDAAVLDEVVEEAMIARSHAVLRMPDGKGAA